ncbi:MAG TPA: hypothetical protein VF681_11175 [Abditibacteriaceae bacterium]
MMDPDLAQWMIIGGLTAVVHAIKDGWKNSGGLGPTPFGLQTADFGEVRSQMRQFAARFFDPTAMMIEHDPILYYMTEHKGAQRPIAGGDGIFPAVRWLI